MTNYELKKWELKENKTIIKLEGENNTEKTIEINNTYENIMLQVKNMIESDKGECKFANGFINIDIVKNEEGKIKLIEDTLETKNEYHITKMATIK